MKVVFSNSLRQTRHTIAAPILQRYQPDPALAELVHYVWTLRTETDEPQAFPDLLVPDGYAELIFVRSGGYVKQFVHTPEQSTMITQSVLLPIRTRSQLVRRLEPVDLIGIKLKPTALFQLLRRNDLLATGEALSERTTPWLHELETSLSTDYADEDALRIIRQHFLQQLLEHEPLPRLGLIHEVLHLIDEHAGVVALQEVVRELPIGVRQFQRYFKQYVGITAKQYANIVRFKHYYRNHIVDELKTVDYFDAGYFDQAHFIRDFKKYLGTTPSNVQTESFRAVHRMARISRKK